MLLKFHLLAGKFLALEAIIDLLFLIAGSCKALGPEETNLFPKALAASSSKGEEEFFESGIMSGGGSTRDENLWA